MLALKQGDNPRNTLKEAVLISYFGYVARMNFQWKSIHSWRDMLNIYRYGTSRSLIEWAMSEIKLQNEVQCPFHEKQTISQMELCNNNVRYLNCMMEAIWLYTCVVTLCPKVEYQDDEANKVEDTCERVGDL